LLVLVEDAVAVGVTVLKIGTVAVAVGVGDRGAWVAAHAALVLAQRGVGGLILIADAVAVAVEIQLVWRAVAVRVAFTLDVVGDGVAVAVRGVQAYRIRFDVGVDEAGVERVAGAAPAIDLIHSTARIGVGPAAAVCPRRCQQHGAA